MRWCCRSGFSLLQWTHSDKWRLLDEERVDHSGIKTKTSVPVFVSTPFYVFLASFIEGGLWFSSELVGPFSIAIGYLTEFFSPGNGVASIQEFFYHYILYYELFSFVFILLLFILGESNREEFLINFRFCKRNWLKYLVWGSCFHYFKWVSLPLSTR